MHAWGHPCDVIAPSLIPKKPGVQRKHDKYDAGQLARLYRAGELTAIHIPSEAEERVRDLVRCRETLQREVVKSRHYILKFLARRGLIYRDGTNWKTAALPAWLRQLLATTSPLATEDRIVFGEYFGLLEYKLARREYWIASIEELARRRTTRRPSGRSAAFAGSRRTGDGARHRDRRLAAVCHAAATHGVSRLRAAGDSSGPRQWLGAITKAGNAIAGMCSCRPPGLSPSASAAALESPPTGQSPQ